MRKKKESKLNIRLMAVFFVAIFLISLVSSVVFLRLLNTLEKEARTVNMEQFNISVGRLDSELNKLVSNYRNLSRHELFRYYNEQNPGAYTLMCMKNAAHNVLSISHNIYGWAVFLNNAEIVINEDGTYGLETYTQQQFTGEGYDAAFWKDQQEQRFARAFFPACDFLIVDGNLSEICNDCVPMALKSYWENNLMVVFFLNIEALLAAAGCDWDSRFYIFSEGGELIYTPETAAGLSGIPEEESMRLEGEKFEVLRAVSGDMGLQFVRLVPETEAAGLVKSSLSFFLSAMIISLAGISVFAVLSIRATMNPVNDMLDLLKNHSGDDDNAHEALCRVLKNLEEQAQALAQKDTVLSEYLLRSHLSNVRVNVGTAELPQDSTYILFIQIRYRQPPELLFSVKRSEVESLFQEMLSGILRGIFPNALAFQLEPGKFAARVSPGNENMEALVAAFLERLEEEREFAWFTVVQSEVLHQGTDLSVLYTRILEAAGSAWVREETQLLRLPLEGEVCEPTEFTAGDRQMLQTAVRSGKLREAVEWTQELLDRNLERKICYLQLENLCVALVNTVALGAEKSIGGNEMVMATGSVLSALMTKCDCPREYRETVLEFVRQCAGGGSCGEERDYLLSQVAQYLQCHYSRDFSIEEMAEALGLSRSYLSSYYKAKTGSNLSDTISLYRVEKAMELLRQPGLKTADVGIMVGFASESTFQRQFKKCTGMTPREYRVNNP